MAELRFLPFRPAAASPGTGLYVPLYVYPAGEGATAYERVVNTKIAHPSVPMVVALNPGSGPGRSRDENYVLAAGRLQAAGITVIGYVYTSWGERRLAEVAADIARYAEWYGLDGVMLDEFSTDIALGDYYRHVRDYVRSLGMGFVMGNPGTDIPRSFVGLATNFIIYENAGLPDKSRIGGWHGDHGKENWSICVHGVDLDEKKLRAASKYLGFVYLTDDTLPNPYDSVCSYLERMAEILDTS